jgi:hypothetical protein
MYINGGLPMYIKTNSYNTEMEQRNNYDRYLYLLSNAREDKLR